MGTKQIVLLAFTIILLSSCSTCVKGPSAYIRGEMIAELNDEGAFVAKSVSAAGLPRYTLRRNDDTVRVYSGSTFVLDIPDVLDLGKRSIKVDKIETVRAGNADKNYFAITLVDACTPVVHLRDKCHIVNWYNPYRLPQIDVANGHLDQIVATPIVSGDDYIIGYEIRLGDISVSDCKSPAYKSWKARYETDTGKQPKGRTRAKAPASTKDTPQSPSSLLTIKVQPLR